MSFLRYTLLRLDVGTNEALDLDKHVENGGTIELYHVSSEQRQFLDKLRPFYSVTFYTDFVQIKNKM